MIGSFQLEHWCEKCTEHVRALLWLGQAHMYKVEGSFRAMGSDSEVHLAVHTYTPSGCMFSWACTKHIGWA